MKKIIVYSQYTEDPSLLVAVTQNYRITKLKNFTLVYLKSNCRVTSQPDWGDVFIIHIRSKNTIDAHSIKKYVMYLIEMNVIFMKRFASVFINV